MISIVVVATCIILISSLAIDAFVPVSFDRSTIGQRQRNPIRQQQQEHHHHAGTQSITTTYMAATAATGEKEKAAPLISGADLEVMLADLDTPLVVDAYATWCGPCLLMAPEFEEAAQELKGRVKFAKLDTDQDEAMAARLNIMGLPTLLFLDKYVAPDGEEDTGARAVLKGRIEGALRKQNIIDLCEYHFFDGPEPKIF